MSASRLSFKQAAILNNRFLSFLLVLVSLWVVTGGAMAAPSILLVLSDAAEAYDLVARAFKENLGGRYPVRAVQLDGLTRKDLRPMTGDAVLVVPVGMRATRYLAENTFPGISVLALLVPRESFHGMPWPSAGGRRTSAVFIDQPWDRSLHLIAAFDARLNRVGLVVSDGAGGILDELVRDAKTASLARGQSLIVERIGNGQGVAEALRRLLPNVDVLLLMPDSGVVNTANVQNVLLTSYRFRVPVVGFSPGLVTAGAVAAVYSTPEQIGREGAEMAIKWNPDTGFLPPPRYAREFDLGINERVARSLGLRLPDQVLLRQRMGMAQ